MPKQEKKFRLWTFKSTKTIDKLKSEGIIEAGWDRYAEAGTFVS